MRRAREIQRRINELTLEQENRTSIVINPELLSAWCIYDLIAAHVDSYNGLLFGVSYREDRREPSVRIVRHRSRL